MPSSHATPRSIAAADPRSDRRCSTARSQCHHDLGGVVDVGVVGVGELERPAAGLERRTPHRPVAATEDLLGSISQSAAALHRLVVIRARRRRASAISARHVSQTGDWQASTRRRPSPSSIVNALHPGQPARHHGVLDAGSRAGAARSASTPRAAGCRPSRRRPPGGRRSSARARRSATVAAAPAGAAGRPAAPGRARPPRGRRSRGRAAATRARSRRSSSIVNGSGRTGRSASTTDSATTVWRAQQAKS